MVEENERSTLLMVVNYNPKVKTSEDVYNLTFEDEQLTERIEILLTECVISVGMEKNIVCTPIKGNVGTVKEYISDGDYKITLDVGISNFDFKDGEKSFEYPFDKIKRFQKLLSYPFQVELHSEFLKAFDIDTAIIESYSLQQETHTNRQSYIITMLSDKDYIIKLRDNLK